jgi:ribonuclease Y
MVGNWTLLAQDTTSGGGIGPIAVVIVSLLMLAFGVGVGYLLNRMLTGQTVATAKVQATQLLEQARGEAETAAEKVRLEVEREALRRKENFDKEVEAVRSELRDTERRLGKRSDQLDRREDTTSEREAKLEARTSELDEARAAIEAQRAKAAEFLTQQEAKLREITGIDRARATEMLLERVAESSRADAARVARKIIEDAEEQAKDKAREITLMAVQRYATEHTSESTVRTVAIPSDDMKGRIIGREGRNIRAIERRPASTSSSTTRRASSSCPASTRSARPWPSSRWNA